MPLVTHWPLSESFAGVNSIQANGSDDPGPSPSGDEAPAGIAGRLEIVADPTGVRGGVMRATLYETDLDTAGHKRSEIARGPDTEDEYWYSWWLMLDPDWGDLSYAMILMQMHDTPDGSDVIVKSPNAMLTLLNGHLRVLWPPGLPSETSETTRASASGVTPGVWYHCCLHVRWKQTAAGFREFFLNGVRVAGEYGVPTGYVDAVAPFLKLGVYDSLNAPAGWVMRRAYYSDVRVWQGPATHLEGMGMHATAPQSPWLALR